MKQSTLWVVMLLLILVSGCAAIEATKCAMWPLFDCPDGSRR